MSPRPAPASYSARELLVRVCEVGNRTFDLDRLRRDPQLPNEFTCADGAKISVVAGGGTYCVPRPGFGAPEGYSGPFTEVEVWFPGDDEPTGWVPVADLMAYVAEHGGVVSHGPSS